MPVQQEMPDAPGFSTRQQRQIVLTRMLHRSLAYRFRFSANFFNFVRALAICERTVALEQSSRRRHFLGRQLFHIAQNQSRALSGRQTFQPGGQPFALFGTEHRCLGRLGMAFGSFSDLTKRHSAVAAQKIERGIGGDARQPVRGFQFVLELLLTLQGLDEGLLREILRVVDIADHTVNLPENAPQILRDEALLQIGRERTGFEQRPALPIVVGGRRIGLFHANLQR